MKLTPQAKTVLNHLRQCQHLTSLQAEGVYRIRRLASRIDELRAAGYGINKSVAKDVTGQRYTRYFLTPAQAVSKTPVYAARPPRAARLTMDALKDAMVDVALERHISMEPFRLLIADLNDRGYR